MIGYPLDSHVSYTPQGVPQYDRAITSAPLRKLYGSLFSDGVLPNPSTNLQVQAGEGMEIIVNAGFAMCNGCMKLEETARTLAVPASERLNRIDSVVLRLNCNDDVRSLELAILKGTAATSPLRPPLTRTETIWEIALADINVGANTSSITDSAITDTRYETARCGIISSISQFDTTSIYNQVMADLHEFQEINEEDFIAWMNNQTSDFDTWYNNQTERFIRWMADKTTAFDDWSDNFEGNMFTWMNSSKNSFDTWFATLQNVLDADTAAHLQNEITELDNKDDGFIEHETTFSPDGNSIVETFQNKRVETDFVSDSLIVQRLYKDNLLVATKNITFSGDGNNIREEIV